MQKPLGLLSLLDEESTFPNATDLTFANKLKQHLDSNSCFRGERGKALAVRHYAGEVGCCYTFIVPFRSEQSFGFFHLCFTIYIIVGSNS